MVLPCKEEPVYCVHKPWGQGCYIQWQRDYLMCKALGSIKGEKRTFTGLSLPWAGDSERDIPDTLGLMKLIEDRAKDR